MRSREQLAAILADDQQPTRLHTGRDWLTLGAALRRGGQRSAARDALTRADGIFVSVGAQGWIDRASAELRALVPAQWRRTVISL